MITGTAIANTLAGTCAFVPARAGCSSAGTLTSPTRFASAYQPKLCTKPPRLPRPTAMTPARARRITRRNFHSSIVPPGENVVRTPDGEIVGAAVPSGNHPKGVAPSLKGGNYGRIGAVLGLELGLARRPPAPGEPLLVPAGELGERNAFVGGLDEPAVADVDRGVENLRSLRVRAARAEEDHVRGLQLLEADPLRAWDLDAHRVRRPALERRGERALVRIALELVDAPDESGTIVAAARRDAEVGLRVVAGTAPDVRHPDLREGDVEDLTLPVGDLREGERCGEAFDLGDLPAVGEQAEAEDLCRRVRGFGTRCRILRSQLEGVLCRRMVEAEAEQTGDDLGAEAARDGEAVGAYALHEFARRLLEADRLHEALVELRHRLGSVRRIVRGGRRPTGSRGVGRP